MALGSLVGKDCPFSTSLLCFCKGHLVRAMSPLGRLEGTSEQGLSSYTHAMGCTHSRVGLSFDLLFPKCDTVHMTVVLHCIL